MTGANFAVAETGTVVVCTNEGNADLSVNLPKLYIASIGIEKVIPRIEHLGVFVRMLSRSALGSPITQLTSHFRAPRHGTQMHVILVDNGRSERLGMADFWYSLKCIRCGACMNTCPVYRRSGGLSYGATYSGPIGVIIDPTFNLRKYSSLPFASTLEWQLHQRLPGQDQHPRADLQMARDHRQAPPASVRQAASHAHRRKGVEQPEAVPCCGRDRRQQHRSPAATDDVQPAQCVGPAT